MKASKYTPHDPITALPHLPDVYDAASWLDTSAATVRALIKLKKLEEVRVGRRLRVTRASLAAFARVTE